MNFQIHSIDRILTLKGVIKKHHGCNCAYIDSVSVNELIGKGIDWRGVVDVFKLFNHPEAEWAFGWITDDGEPARCITMLGTGPVNSPAAAVKNSILQDGF